MSRKVSVKNKDKIVVPLHMRPVCKVAGCNNKTQHLGTYKANGYPNFRAYCMPCHEERRIKFQKKASLVDRRTLPKCQVPSCSNRVEVFGSHHNGDIKYTVFCKDHVGLVNSYSLFRKSYCENIDGRLGFTCTTNIIWEGMLDVDHINGNPYDDRVENLQTLCKCCHAYKGHVNGDRSTPGRKTLKESKKNGMLTKLINQ